MKNEFLVIGLMSGTSMDGLDIAFCKFKWSSGRWNYNLLNSKTIDFPNNLAKRLSTATLIHGLELTQLDHDFGVWMGECVKGFIENEKIKPDLIASHGHTVFHQPQKRITLQIGNLNAIHASTGIPVSGDFRRLDIALNGQGAPLVPIGDLHLFGKYDFCINLGGISNISFDYQDQRLAFDICPVNIVLNHLANKKGEKFDKNGELAARGNLNEDLLKKLNNLDFYNSFRPKSLGIEWVRQNIFPILEQLNISVEDQLNTFSHHIAFQIQKTIEHFRKSEKSSKILITGGGAFNSFLIKKIKERLNDKVECEIPAKEIISFKEALIFAFIGLLKYRNEINVLASVTGATKNSSSGVIIGN